MMGEELTEPIMRQIMRISMRIRENEDSIALFESILQVRREETGLSHEALMIADPQYRHTANAIRSLRGWITRYRKMLEDLAKRLPPLIPPAKRMLRTIITFSIETGRGHEPLFAEVTCDTIVDPEANIEQLTYRIVNATIKLFWICFDSFKDILKEYRAFWGAKEYDDLLKDAIFVQKYAEKVTEEWMDKLIKRLIKHGAFQREPDEYATRQAIIKIGVEYQSATDQQEPLYPTVHTLIEKGRSAEQKGDWIIERTIIIAPETDVNILKLLQMEVEIKYEDKSKYI